MSSIFARIAPVIIFALEISGFSPGGVGGFISSVVSSIFARIAAIIVFASAVSSSSSSGLGGSGRSEPG